MAEPLGIISAVSAIAGLIDSTARLLANGYAFAAKVKRAPIEIHGLLHEVAGLSVVLAQIQDWVNENEISDSKSDNVVAALARLGVIDSCKQLLMNVENTIKTCEQAQGQHVKNFGKRLAWPFKEKEVRDTIQQLGRLRETLSASMVVDSRSAINRIESLAAEIQSDVSNVKGFVTSEVDSRRRQTLLNWVSPDDANPDENLDAALQQRQENTGLWFLDCEKFNLWTETQNSLLWIHGIPGCGKTVLSATVIEHLQQTRRLPDSAVVYFYCDHRFPKKQTPRNFFMTIALQLILAKDECFTDVERLYNSKTREEERKISNSDYHELVRALSLRFSSVYIIVDALDEGKELDSFVEEIYRLSTGASQQSRCRILVTSRTDAYIEKLLLQHVTLDMSLNDQMRKDIKTYVSTQIKTRLGPKKFMSRDPNLVNEIVKVLVDNAGGLFLQAKLQLDHLCGLKTLGAIKSALKKLPNGLDETYDQILQTIMNSNPDELEMIRNMLLWLVGAVWELRLDVLAETLAVRVEDDRLEWDNVPDPDDIAEMLSSLVIVDRDPLGATIRLAHFSIEEYLCSGRLENGPLKFFHMDRDSVDADLAQTCIKYLSFQDFGREDINRSYPNLAAKASMAGTRNAALIGHSSGEEFDVLTQNYRFLEYAANNWMIHLANADILRDYFDENIGPHLKWFLNSNPKPTDQYCLWHFVVSSNLSQFAFPKTPQPPLYHAIMFGLEHPFDILLPSYPHLDGLLSSGQTFLTVAARFNQVPIALKLIAAGADPNLTDSKISRKGLTPLHIAAERGAHAMCALLLSHGASPHARSNSHTTPLYRAARAGSVPVLTLLHAAGADIEAQSYDHWTPLMEAAECGHLPALKQLLEWGANPKARNDDGDTALAYAHAVGSREMVDTLLEAMGTTREKVEMALPARMRSWALWRRALDQSLGVGKQGESYPLVCCACGSGFRAAEVGMVCCDCEHTFCAACKSNA